MRASVRFHVFGPFWSPQNPVPRTRVAFWPIPFGGPLFLVFFVFVLFFALQGGWLFGFLAFVALPGLGWFLAAFHFLCIRSWFFCGFGFSYPLLSQLVFGLGFPHPQHHQFLSDPPPRHPPCLCRLKCTPNRIDTFSIIMGGGCRPPPPNPAMLKTMLRMLTRSLKIRTFRSNKLRIRVFRGRDKKRQNIPK